jgi:hypothetical protein
MLRQFDIEEHSIRRKSRGATGDGGEAAVWSSRFGSQAGPRSWRKQRAPELIKIGQRKHGLRPGQVFGQPPVPDLGKTPQLLDHPKRVFAAARVRERARLISRQRSLNGVLLGRRLIR